MHPATREIAATFRPDDSPEAPHVARLVFSTDRPAGPDESTIRPAELARIAMAAADAVADAARARAEAAGRSISCRRGCGACCRQLVPVSIPEALRISEVVEAMTEPLRSDVRRRFDEAVAAFARAGLLEELRSLADPLAEAARGAEAHYELARRYFELGIACPFLEEESCSIHEDRPAACREHLALSPPAWCEEPFERTVDRAPASVEVERALALVWSMREGGMVETTPLALAFDRTRRLAREGAAPGEVRWDRARAAADLLRALEVVRED